MKINEPKTCIKCLRLFGYKDYIAAFTAEDKDKKTCIDCQLKVKKMKITEEELIEELESLRDNAQENILEAHRMKLPSNSYGLGYDAGERDTADRILRYIKEGFE